jgi:hypothetical protein
MKYLSHFQGLNYHRHPAVVYLNNNLENGAESEKGIDALLNNPLSFSFSQINVLEAAIKEQQNALTPLQQRQFAKLINYHLARFKNEGENSVRSRTLLAIFRAPLLNQFLSPSQRQGIEMMLNKERKELEKFGSKGASTWKPYEAIRVARSYRFVRNRLNTANLRINPDAKNTGDNLKLYASRLVEKTKLETLDRLFLIELSQIFPKSGDWENSRVFEQVQTKTNEIQQDFKQVINSGGNIPADARYYWDTLTPTVESGADKSLKAWLKRSAEVESLQAILEKDRPEADMEAVKVPLLLSFEEYTFLEALTSTPADQKIDTNGEAARALKAQSDLATAAKAELDALNGERETQVEALKNASPQALKDNPDVGPTLKTSFKDEWLNLNFETPADEAETARINDFETWRTAVAKELSEKSKETDKEKITNAEAKAAAAEAKVKNLQTAYDALQADMEIYANPAEQAQKALNNHKKYFTARLKAGRLLAIDLDLLAQVNKKGSVNELFDVTLAEKGAQVTGLITETREVIEAALVDELQINDLYNLDESELDKVDKFLSYEGVLASITKAKLNKQNSNLLRNFEALDQGGIIDARQVLSAVTLGIRRDVMAGLNPLTDQKSTAYNKFLDNYSRQHQAINQTDKVEKMLGFTADIEKQKQEKVNDAYEHAYEKVSSLFAKAEENSIIEGLNKILKVGLSGSTTLNNIQAILPDDRFIHSASKSDIAGYERAIVEELSGKVTPENDDKLHLTQIARDLLAKLDQMQSSEVAKLALKQGAQQMEKNKKGQLKVSERLELARRTRLVYLEAVEVNENIQLDLDDIKLALEKSENTDALVSNFLQKYSESYAPRFNTLKQALIEECDLLFETRTEFTSQLDLNITQVLKNLDGGIQQIRSVHNDPSKNLSAQDSGFKVLVGALNNDLIPLFNFDSGDTAVVEDHKINSTLENSSHTHKYVRDELGVMQPEGAVKGRKKYEANLKEYKTTVAHYKLAWEEAKKRLEKDLKKYNEDEFAFKHKMPKKAARELVRINDQRGTDAQYLVDSFSGKTNESHFKGSENGLFDRWLKAYEHPETQPLALDFMNQFKDFKDTLGPEHENFAKEIEDMQAFRRDFDNNKPTLWLKKKYSFEIKWYTLKSIYMMAKQGFEFWGKRTERRNDRMASELGARIFGDTAIGREFSRDSNEKQDQRVSDFKNVHKSSNYQQLFKIIENATKTERDKDEVQAAVELIMEKGELRWDSPEFLAMLGRLQNVVTFDPEKDIKAYIENPAQLKQKIGMAVTAIWDRPTWLQWKEDLPSKYKSRLDTHNNDYREEVQKGSVDTYLGNALAQWTTGEVDTNFERSKFESYLKNAFDNGEMNGYPNGDRRWYYLIMGLTLKNPQGDTILSPDTLSRFGELQNKMPFMDAFDDGVSWKKNGRVVPEGTSGAHQAWNYDDFEAWGRYFEGIDPRSANSAANKKHTIKCVRRWLNETLLTTNDAQDRMAKAQPTGIDRDDAGMLPLLMSAERLADGLLRYSSGDKRPADDKYYVNLLGSFNNNFEDSVEYMKHILENEDKEADGYEDRKVIQLRRFGEMMRTYLMISQSLAGNWDTGGTVGAVMLSNAEWNQNNGAEIYEAISDEIVDFADDQSLKILKGKRFQIQKSTEGKKQNTLKPGHEEVLNTVKNLFDSKIFEDVDRIEAYLRKKA